MANDYVMKLPSNNRENDDYKISGYPVFRQRFLSKASKRIFIQQFVQMLLEDRTFSVASLGLVSLVAWKLDDVAIMSC